jgi:hypothetical protein
MATNKNQAGVLTPALMKYFIQAIFIKADNYLAVNDQGGHGGQAAITPA